MEKAKRLKLYSEKDYTETIDFPVELVGRDGVVRRYSYADSIRIYERRIESAHIRYADREIINAEIYHCSRRLEQIQRSWKVRISSSERKFVEGRPGVKERELYERGKQFLKAYIEQIFGGTDQPPEFGTPNLVNLEERGDHQVFYVNWPIFHPGTLLYVYRFNEGDDPLRAEYQRYLELLRLAELAPDTEKMVHHEDAQDMAFILTSQRHEALLRLGEASRAMMMRSQVAQRKEYPDDLAWIEGVLEEGSTPEDGPYRLGLEELRRNDFESAFGHFKEALEENPFYKEAYWALAALTDILGRWEESESYLLMALKYFPEEPRAHFYYGLVTFRKKRLKEAQDAFQQSIRLNIRQSRAYGFMACVQALRGQYRTAADTLERGLRLFPRDQSLLKLALPLQHGLRWQGRRMHLGVALVLVLAALSIASREPLLWGTTLAVAAAVLLARFRQQSECRRQLWAWARPS